MHTPTNMKAERSYVPYLLTNLHGLVEETHHRTVVLRATYAWSAWSARGLRLKGCILSPNRPETRRVG
jgi:hypothetical protein